MLYNKNDSQTYMQEFRKRFSNFAEKAPVLISYTTTPNAVQVIDETTNDVYEITWDFSIPVKFFIHGIKNMLIEKGCYPVIHKIEEESEAVTTEEQLSMAMDGSPLENIPVKRYKKHIHKFLIDKVIVFKDIFIIKDLETDKMFRYKMNKSSVFFLKKMRDGRFKNKEEAAEYFFSNSALLNEIELKSEVQEGTDIETK